MRDTHMHTKEQECMHLGFNEDDDSLQVGENDVSLQRLRELEQTIKEREDMLMANEARYEAKVHALRERKDKLRVREADVDATLQLLRLREDKLRIREAQGDGDGIHVRDMVQVFERNMKGFVDDNVHGRNIGSFSASGSALVDSAYDSNSLGAHAHVLHATKSQQPSFSSPDTRHMDMSTGQISRENVAAGGNIGGSNVVGEEDGIHVVGDMASAWNAHVYSARDYRKRVGRVRYLA
jgi:hypothetical protein